jgi:hypothetical protein
MVRLCLSVWDSDLAKRVCCAFLSTVRCVHKLLLISLQPYDVYAQTRRLAPGAAISCAAADMPATTLHSVDALRLLLLPAVLLLSPVLL